MFRPSRCQLQAGIWNIFFVCFLARQPPPHWARASSFTRFLDHTQRRTTVSMTPLDEWSARRRDLYLTTHNTHHNQTSIPPVGFEPRISADERPHTYALDRAATGTGIWNILGSFYLRTSDVDEVPRGEGHLGPRFGGCGARRDRIPKFVVGSFRLDSIPEAEDSVNP